MQMGTVGPSPNPISKTPPYRDQPLANVAITRPAIWTTTAPLKNAGLWWWKRSEMGVTTRIATRSICAWSAQTRQYLSA